jgi:hypothetical protein
MAEVSPHDDPAAATPPVLATATLAELRDQIMPLLEAVQAAYTGRVQPGYPVLVDSVERGGFFGIALDPRGASLSRPRVLPVGALERAPDAGLHDRLLERQSCLFTRLNDLEGAG